MKGETEVRRRIAEIDGAPPGTTTPSGLLKDLAWVVHVLGAAANTHNPNIPMAKAAVLDGIVQESQLLHRLSADLSAIIWKGHSNRQLWTGSVSTNHIPSAASFVPLTTDEKLRVKPTRQGLYTSTHLPGTEASSMWLMYLEQFGRGLFPKPWRTYALAVADGSRIYDVRSAEAWTQLVLQYPLEHAGLVYPDWAQIATKYDAVHFTVSAVVAIQEIRLAAGGFTVPEGYWDAEQTLWLNWCFDSVQQVSIGGE